MAFSFLKSLNLKKYEWGILIIIFFGICGFFLFYPKSNSTEYSGMNGIEWFSSLEKNSSEMILQRYYHDGRGSLYYRKNETLRFGNIKPLEVGYTYQDGFLTIGFAYFTKIDDFVASKKYLDSLYLKKSESLDPQTSQKFTTWQGKNHKIFEMTLNSNVENLKKGYYLFFAPDSKQFQRPQTLFEKKNYPKATVLISTSDQLTTSTNNLGSVWWEFGTKYHTQGLEFLDPPVTQTEFNRLYKDKKSISTPDFIEVSKNLKAKYGFLINTQVGRIASTYVGNVQKTEFFIQTKFQILDIETGTILYEDQFTQKDIPSDEELRKQFPKTLLVMTSLIKKAPPLPKQ